MSDVFGVPDRLGAVGSEGWQVSGWVPCIQILGYPLGKRGKIRRTPGSAGRTDGTDASEIHGMRRIVRTHLRARSHRIGAPEISLTPEGGCSGTRYLSNPPELYESMSATPLLPKRPRWVFTIFSFPSSADNLLQNHAVSCRQSGDSTPLYHVSAKAKMTKGKLCSREGER